MNKQTQSREVRLDYHWAEAAHGAFIGLYATTKEGFESGDLPENGDLFQVLIPDDESGAGNALHDAVIRACGHANMVAPGNDAIAIRAALAGIAAGEQNPHAELVAGKLRAALPAAIIKLLESGDVKLVYLTNACGEDTGNGTLVATEEDLQKVPFERGPGCVNAYLVEVAGGKYVLGNLEVCYKDDFWGSDQSYAPQAEVQQYCERISSLVGARLTTGEMLLPIDADSPGRFAVQVAIPLEALTDWGSTLIRLAAMFGAAADLVDLEELGNEPALTA